MHTRECDVLVVGGGPAGSCAAREAAAHGARVLVVERRPVIGVPVQCAEYIPAQLLGEAGVGSHSVVQSVEGMVTHLNGTPIQALAAPGFMIRRDRFDQSLAEAARQAGAAFLLDTAAEAWDGESITARRRDGTGVAIRAGVVIGADGPRSRVGRWMGSVNHDLIPAVQVRVPLCGPLSCTEVYFDDRIYAGYGWLFPKGETANVGLGMKRRSPDTPSIGAVLARLVDQLAEQGKIRKTPCATSAGWIPAEAPRCIVRDRLLLVGDAAGHTHPITGAGVTQAVLGGRMAGVWAARAALADDPTLLEHYASQWDDYYGATHSRAFSRRQRLERHWDALPDIIRQCWIGFREYHGTA